ncbi:MAG: PQQ-dependent sugar dehydrogenase [Bacteroidota bacterium]
MKNLIRSIALFAACFIGFSRAGLAQNQPAEASTFAVRVVKENLFIPWEIIYGPDNMIWYTQKNGYICRLNPLDGSADTIYFEPNLVIRNEGGMLGMALHPDFANTPQVFVVYEYVSGANYLERVIRLDYNGSRLVNPQIILDNISGNTIHNGSRLMALADKLYISTGDAANTGLAQRTDVINGKILRINFDGSIPADNPIPNSPVWNWGQRNVQGLVFANRSIYSSMHGANNDDEINILQKGRNYGWPNVEGFCNTAAELAFCNDSNVVEPIKAWTPTIAVSGIDYYNHPMFPELQNSLVMATLKDQKLHILKLNAAGDSITSDIVITQVAQGRLRDVCVSPEGSVFISTSNSNAAGTGVHGDKILELYNPLATGIKHNKQLKGVTLYPNPANSQVTDKLQISVTGNVTGRWNYYITDFYGRRVQAGNIIFPASLSLASLNSGAYLLRCEDGTGNTGFVRKFIKE